MKSWNVKCCCVVIGLLGAAPAAAEVFVLENEGRVSGEWLNKEDKEAEQYIVRTATGGTVKLAKDQVARVYVPSAEELEYEKIRGDFEETAADQWNLAEWCRQNRLREQRTTHLKRCIELDPDHADARRALGYTRIDNQWKTQDESFLERGYVRYRGKWMLPQEVELAERIRANKKETGEWFVKIKRWRGWLDDARAEQAEDALLGITDPNAVPALKQFFESEKDAKTRLLFVDALAKVNSSDAVYVLGDGALYDGDQEVRLTCLDYLKKEPRPDLVKYYASALKHKDNVTVNRAAYCLKELNDDSVVSALIDALVTTHKTKIGADSGGDQYTTTFGGSSGGGIGGMNAGGGGLSINPGPKVLVQHLRNVEVLDALVSITGANFGYDTQAWKYWLTSQQKVPAVNVRRDAP